MGQRAVKTRPKLVCLCNEVSVETVEAAITRGCHKLGQIFDSTNAGCGACGGSCQPQIQKMIDTYLETGKFPPPPERPPRRR